ncbi:MAG: hypothetical protein M5U26_23210 [Planctomycetota bacterium]|nr:hypothetical protein [Planctomycetota bacterium]
MDPEFKWLAPFVDDPAAAARAAYHEWRRGNLCELERESFVLTKRHVLESLCVVQAAREERDQLEQERRRLEALPPYRPEMLAHLMSLLSERQSSAREWLVSRLLGSDAGTGLRLMPDSIQERLYSAPKQSHAEALIRMGKMHPLDGFDAAATVSTVALLAVLTLTDADLRTWVETHIEAGGMPAAEREQQYIVLVEAQRGVEDRIREGLAAKGRVDSDGRDRWLTMLYLTVYFSAHATSPCDHAARAIQDGDAQALAVLGLRRGTHEPLFRPTSAARWDLIEAALK